MPELLRRAPEYRYGVEGSAGERNTWPLLATTCCAYRGDRRAPRHRLEAGVVRIGYGSGMAQSDRRVRRDRRNETAACRLAGLRARLGEVHGVCGKSPIVALAELKVDEDNSELAEQIADLHHVEQLAACVCRPDATARTTPGPTCCPGVWATISSWTVRGPRGLAERPERSPVNARAAAERDAFKAKLALLRSPRPAGAAATCRACCAGCGEGEHPHARALNDLYADFRGLSALRGDGRGKRPADRGEDDQMSSR